MKAAGQRQRKSEIGKYNKYKGGSNRKQSDLDWIQCYHLLGTINKKVSI